MNHRLKNLLNYAMTCIQRYRVRTLVILICLTASSAIFSSVAFMKDGLVKEGALSLTYTPDITVQGIEGGRQTFIETREIGTIQETANVRLVEPRIWGYGNIGNTLLVIVGVDVETLGTNLALAYPLESGVFLTVDSTDEIVIGKAVADLLGIRVGSILTILTESVQARQYTVKGIFNSQSSIYSADMILMNINEARGFFNLPEEKVTDLAVYVSDLNYVNNVARDLSEIPNVRVITKEVLLKAQEATYGARSGFFSIVWSIILLSVAIIAFNQTVVVGRESKFEVGLLKALGFSTLDIIKIRLLESTVLGLLAGSLGIAAGIIYDRVLNAPVLKDFMMGWAALYPSFSVPIYISASTVIFTYAITIIPLLFATVIPSWVNATVDPDLAMRGAQA